VKNIAIIGCGAIAIKRHAPALAAAKNACFYAVCDPVKENADSMAKQYGIKAYYDISELLSDDKVDAVIICTPERFHCANIIAALEAGKDVMCEKPLALDAKEGQKIVDVWKKSGKLLMVAFSQRLTDAHQLAKKMIDEGVIGKPIAFRTELAHAGVEYSTIDQPSPDYFDKRLSSVGDVMLNVGCHRIDVIPYLFNSKIKSVMANTPTIDKKFADGSFINAPDHAMIIAQLENGLHGTFWISWCSYGEMERNSMIYGTKGSLSVYEGPGIVLRLHGEEPQEFELPFEPEDDYRITWNFIDTLNGTGIPIADGLDGLNCLIAMAAINLSNKECRKVDVSEIV
jgi:predicted dehydrogenase